MTLHRPYLGFRFLSALLVGFGAVASSVYDCSAESQPDAALQQSADIFKAVSANIKKITLKNGLRVVLYRRGTAPVFSGAVVVRVGGSDEVLGQTGVSHLFEHMAFKGSPEIGVSDYAREKPLLDELEVLAAKQRTTGVLSEEDHKRWDEVTKELKSLWITDQFTREYDKRGAVGMNATTDTDMTRYFVSMPRSAFEFWLYMESERLINPVMRQFYQERDVVMEERRMRFDDDPEGKLYDLLLGMVFRAHPYHNPVIGYPFDLQRVTATMVNDFRKAYYIPSNIAVGLVGDVDVEKDLPLIEKYFGRIPVGPVPNRPIAIEPAQEGERRVVLEERASPQVLIAYRKPNFPHPDDAPISVMLEMLSGSSVSPMYKELVQRQKIVTSISQGEGPGVAYPNFALFQAAIKSPHTNDEFIAAFDKVLEGFIKTGANAEALAIAKRSIAMTYLGQLNSSMPLALNFATSEVLYNDWKTAFAWFEQAMAVTVEDVQRVAAQYLVKKNRTIAMLETKK